MSLTKINFMKLTIVQLNVKKHEIRKGRQKSLNPKTDKTVAKKQKRQINIGQTKLH